MILTVSTLKMEMFLVIYSDGIVESADSNFELYSYNKTRENNN